MMVSEKKPMGWTKAVAYFLLAVVVVVGIAVFDNSGRSEKDKQALHNPLASAKPDNRRQTFIDRLQDQKGLRDLGFALVGYNGDQLYLRVDHTWDNVPRDAKEKFLGSIFSAWGRATDEKGWVEVQDYYNGKVIAKAGVLGITIDS